MCMHEHHRYNGRHKGKALPHRPPSTELATPSSAPSGSGPCPAADEIRFDSCRVQDLREAAQNELAQLEWDLAPE